MNENVADDALERAYRPFEQNHAQGRSELLETISQLPRTSGGTSTRTKRRRLGPIVLSLAAVLLVGVTLAITLWPPGAPRALAVEEARRQLLEVRSLYLKGWIFQTIEKDGNLQEERFPTEFYAERPCRYWSNGYGFSFEGNHKLLDVTHSYSATNGETSIWVSHDQRLARFTPTSRLNAVLHTERLLQQKIFDRLLTGVPDSYRVVDKEELGGVACDVYESHQPPQDSNSFGQRSRLWLNAVSGLPVRLKVWSRLGKEAEKSLYEYHTIEVNGPPPEEMFIFQAPAGYRTLVVEGEAERITLPEGPIASGGGRSMGTWGPFEINDRAALFCWWVDPPHDQDGLQTIPDFSLGKPGQERPCQHIPLRTDERWNWSLFLPEDDGRIDLDDRLVVRLTNPRARLSSDARPLRLPKEQLERILLEAQKSTIPADSDIEPFTLEDIAGMLHLIDSSPEGQ